MNIIKTHRPSKPPYAGFFPDILALGGLIGLLVIFYPELFLARSASLMGDHWEQHYPWAFSMAQSLRQGIGPLWTPLIQCGFPIVAESQMGFFYLPNLLLYATLPIKWAYAYMNLFHFYIAAVGTYLYTRKIGVNSWGAFVAAVVFTFGTGYGGAYYNITSLKTIAWFPWILFGFENFLAGKRFLYGALMAFLFSLAILAGYMQVAFLAIAIIGFYVIARVFIFFPEELSFRSRVLAILGMIGVGLSSLALASPQLLLTFELAQFSNRINLSESYAYVGSLSPFTLLTIVFPILQGVFRGSCLYSGIFAIIFSIASFFVAAKGLRTMLWLWVTVGVVSLLLALGQWSPLYVSLVKLTHFYSFRVPAKFLIFFCFSTAMLAGIGVHAIREDLRKNNSKTTVFADRCLEIALFIFALWGLAYFCLSRGRSWLTCLGKWGIENFIYGKSGHPRSLESYLETLSYSIDGARGMLSFTSPWQIWAVVLIILCCAWTMLFRRNVRPVLLLPVAIIILLTDLYVFAGADIKRDFDTFQNVLRPNGLVKTLLAEKAAGKVGRIYGYRKEGESLPLIPSVNMIYGIEDIGGYSPFIMSRYFETIGQFGNVNDSNRMQEPEISFVLERLPLLNALDVSHILSTREIRHQDLELLFQDPASGACLYRNQEDHSRGYFISSAILFSDWLNLKKMLMAPGFDPRKVLLLENSEKTKLHNILINKDSKVTGLVRTGQEPDREIWSLETTGSGFLVVASTLYPGWEAEINGQKTPLLLAYGLFRAVWIPKAGKHCVELCYKPYPKLGLPRLKR